MSLQALHRRVNFWIQRPVGRMAGWLLLVAMILAGMPTGEVHAHADGDSAHDHAVQLVDGLSDPVDASVSPDPVEPTLLHAHDLATSVSTLPALPAVMLCALVPIAPSACLTIVPPPTLARIPPHRPPIA